MSRGACCLVVVPAATLLAALGVPALAANDTPALAANDTNVEAATVDGRCRPNEAGPAVIVSAVGLKDRKGRLRLELYPSNDDDFLADDALLVREGHVFRRVEVPVPVDGPVEICIRAPRAGTYSLSLIHDRAMTRKFRLSADGVGFPGNPKLGLSQPKADRARLEVGSGLTRTQIVLNYRHGLFSFAPIAGAE
ncbi:MAG: DUF2141 domain-containing protein [Janthinobacterium lividum]